MKNLHYIVIEGPLGVGKASLTKLLAEKIHGETLLERIKNRGRKFEKGINPEYIAAINQTFNTFFFHYQESPLLIIDASEIDFVNIPEDLDNLVRQIRNMEGGTVLRSLGIRKVGNLPGRL